MHLESRLAAAGAKHWSLDADHVAWIEVGEELDRLGAEDLAAGNQRDASSAVLQVRERGAAVEALDHEPASKGDRVGPVAIAQKRLRLRARMRRLEPARVRFNPRSSQPFELLAAIADQRRQIELRLFSHRQRLRDEARSPPHPPPCLAPRVGLPPPGRLSRLLLQTLLARRNI